MGKRAPWLVECGLLYVHTIPLKSPLFFVCFSASYDNAQEIHRVVEFTSGEVLNRSSRKVTD